MRRACAHERPRRRSETRRESLSSLGSRTRSRLAGQLDHRPCLRHRHTATRAACRSPARLKTCSTPRNNLSAVHFSRVVTQVSEYQGDVTEHEALTCTDSTPLPASRCTSQLSTATSTWYRCAQSLSRQRGAQTRMALHRACLQDPAATAGAQPVSWQLGPTRAHSSACVQCILMAGVYASPTASRHRCMPRRFARVKTSPW